MERCLQEFRIRGVKTNIPFLINLVTHPKFRRRRLHDAISRRDARAVPVQGAAQDRATKLFNYLADVIVNGHPLVKKKPEQHAPRGRRPCRRSTTEQPVPAGHARQAAANWGPSDSAAGSSKQKRLLITDTTFRDAHQSLLATRVRTHDMLAIADAYARLVPQLFSIEMWGGATFDTAMRFLKECPWQRLADLRERIPNILFQMLLRASNALGYSNYPDNVVQAFVKEAAASGHGRVPHFRLAELGAEHARGDGSRHRNRRDVRGGHLLHRRHPRPRSGPSTT